MTRKYTQRQVVKINEINLIKPGKESDIDGFQIIYIITLIKNLEELQ